MADIIPRRPIFTLLTQYRLAFAKQKNAEEELEVLCKDLIDMVAKDSELIDVLIESLTKKLTSKRQKKLVIDLMDKILVPLIDDDLQLTKKVAKAMSKPVTVLGDSFVHASIPFPEVLRRVLNMKERPTFTQQNLYGETALHKMASIFTPSRRAQLKAILYEPDVDLNASTFGPNLYTPLYIACLRGKFSVVELLCGCGADTNKTAHNNLTPLMVAAQEGHTNIVKYLLDGTRGTVHCGQEF